MDDGDLVRNTDGDGDVMVFMRQALKITNALRAAQEAIAKAQPGSLDPVVLRRDVAEKWGCTPEQAEYKISSTMKILSLDRDNAIAFLASVLPSAIVKPRNE